MPKFYKCPACGKKKLVRSPRIIQCIKCGFINVRKEQ